MSEFYQTILHGVSSSIGVFAGACLAFYFNRRLETDRRKAGILAAIFSVREQVYCLPDIQKAHKDTRDQIRDVISHSLAFLSKASRERLIAAWQQYQNIPDDLLLDDEDAERKRAFARHLDKLNPKSPREVIESMLCYLEDAINRA